MHDACHINKHNKHNAWDMAWLKACICIALQRLALLCLSLAYESLCRLHLDLDEEEVEVVKQVALELQSSPECKLSALQHQVRVHFGAAAALRCGSLQACRAKLKALEGRGEVSFLQFFNLHRRSKRLRSIATSRRFAYWASKLLGVPRVRLYQDALFWKRPGDGATDWHSDLGLAPFDTNSFLGFLGLSLRENRAKCHAKRRSPQVFSPFGCP